MGAKYDAILGKLRSGETITVESVEGLQEALNAKQNKIDDSLSTQEKTVSGAINEIKGTLDSLVVTEEKLIIENTNSTTYISKTKRKILSMDCYNCSNVLFNATPVAVGSVIEADTLFNVTATVSTDRAAIVIVTEQFTETNE